MLRTLTTILLLSLLWGCSSETPAPSPFGTCTTCHSLAHDTNHSMKCTECHRGIEDSEEKERAHQGLVSSPAHPDRMAQNCGKCHEPIVSQITFSQHFALNNSVNLMRQAFGAEDQLDSFIDTPIVTEPANTVELVDNLLRQRCFKCHPFDSGQKYPNTVHGQGCAACHFDKLTGNDEKHHLFSSPNDERCLSCHYGNYVGADYYGRFEHDFNHEYRTPYTTRAEHFRPYGVEYRELSRDIHQIAGLLCIDCHSGNELMMGAEPVQCSFCHDPEKLEEKLPDRVLRDGDSFTFTSQSGAKHNLPILQHSAHYNEIEKISCQGCHAQWSFDDRGRNLMRIDADEFDSYSALTVQGNYEVERILTNNFDFDKDELPIRMTDTITGDSSPGLWLKAYVERRWEEVKLGRNSEGEIVVVRPLLNYSLSWVDEDENVIFDAVQPVPGTRLVQEYTPHTTGPAGMFYRARIQSFLAKEKRIANGGSASLAPRAQ